MLRGSLCRDSPKAQGRHCGNLRDFESSFRCDASVRGNAQTRSGLRAGVELERRPIEGLFEYRVGICGMEEREFGVRQSGGGVLALAQLAVKRVHQLRRGDVADLAHSASEIVR